MRGCPTGHTDETTYAQTERQRKSRRYPCALRKQLTIFSANIITLIRIHNSIYY